MTVSLATPSTSTLDQTVAMSPGPREKQHASSQARAWPRGRTDCAEETPPGTWAQIPGVERSLASCHRTTSHIHSAFPAPEPMPATQEAPAPWHLGAGQPQTDCSGHI